METAELEQKLSRLAEALIDQNAARQIVAASEDASGFWFGGGNMISHEGRLLVVGRYRNAGDSRTGVAAGARGLELAVFESSDAGQTFSKVLSMSKADLSHDDRPVLSIEGTALRVVDGGLQLFVSTEKDKVGYPDGFASYLKPGTGVWSIDLIQASTVEGLADAKIETVLECDSPEFVHIKDPFVYERGDDAYMLFCSHPFCWTSSNTGHSRIVGGGLAPETNYDMFNRGFTWDVAITRGTAVVDVPKVGQFANEDISLVFYDGGWARAASFDGSSAVKRPRGYSCEELGGCGYIQDGDLNNIKRLSKYAPMFVSPHGSGCSRYVDVVKTDDGLIATWQQAQLSGSQPLVMNSLTTEQVANLLI